MRRASSPTSKADEHAGLPFLLVGLVSEMEKRRYRIALQGHADQKVLFLSAISVGIQVTGLSEA